MNNSDNSSLVEIRDSAGRLLFKYNPKNNTVEIKKGGDGVYVIGLDRIRQKYGFLAPEAIPSPLGVEIVSSTTKLKP